MSARAAPGRCCSARTAVRRVSASASTATARLPACPVRRSSTRRRTGRSIAAVRARGLGQRAGPASARCAPSARRACARAWCSTTRRARRSGPARTSTRAPAKRRLSSSPRAKPKRSTTTPGTGSRSPPLLGSAGSPGTSRSCSRQIAHVGMLGDWVLTKLSGEFVTDASLGSSSGMFDLAERDWSEPDTRHLRARVATSSRPSSSPEPSSAAVTAQAAAETGLREGTPVVVGGADTQLGLLGIGVNGPGRFTILGGSFWQHTMLLDKPSSTRSLGLRTLCHTTPGLWMMEGIGFYCGIVMRWFRDAFCELELAQAEAEGVDVYSILEDKAARPAPGVERGRRAVLQRHAGEPLGAHDAWLHRLRRRQPRTLRARRLFPIHRGGGGLRVARAPPDHRGGGRLQGRGGGLHRRCGQGPPVATDRRRHPWDPSAHSRS